MSEENTIIISMEAYTIEEFLLSKSTDPHIAKESMGLITILPNTFRSGTPEVAVVRLNNITDGLVLELFATRETFYSTGLRIVEIESLFCANGNAAVQRASISQCASMEFAHVVTDRIIEQMIPALRAETLCTRVETRYARSCCQPDIALAISSHTLYPVITQHALNRVCLIEIIVAQATRLRIIDTEATRIG